MGLHPPREEREKLKEHIKGLKRRVEEIEKREGVGTERGRKEERRERG